MLKQAILHGFLVAIVSSQGDCKICDALLPRLCLTQRQSCILHKYPSTSAKDELLAKRWRVEGLGVL